MNRPTPASPSWLQQQQPQRYSDRHQQQHSWTGEFQPRWSPAVQQQSAIDKNNQIIEVSDEGALDDQEGINLDLEKAEVTADACAAKPDTAAKAKGLERVEKEGASHSNASGQ